LPKLKTLLSNPATPWRTITVSAWYGRKREKTLEITSDTALWYRPGTPPRPIRWVLVRDPEGKRDPQAFFSTDTDREPADIIALFVRRWQVEVTFAETRAHLGVEKRLLQPQMLAHIQPQRHARRFLLDQAADKAHAPWLLGPRLDKLHIRAGWRRYLLASRPRKYENSGSSAACATGQSDTACDPNSASIASTPSSARNRNSAARPLP
jgi:hypothetical protein